MVLFSIVLAITVATSLRINHPGDNPYKFFRNLGHISKVYKVFLERQSFS